MPANTRLGWKSLTLANTLSYCNAATITIVKSFIVQAPGLIDHISPDTWLPCPTATSSLPYLRYRFSKLRRSSDTHEQECLISHDQAKTISHTGNTKGGSITVQLTSCLTGMESAV